jgi:hypothetical protein
LNNGNSNLSAKPQLINVTPTIPTKPVNLSDRLDNHLLIHTELVAALKKHGCDNCLALLREIIKKYSGISEWNQISLASKGDGPFDTIDNRKSKEVLKDRPVYWANLVGGLWQQKKFLNPIYSEDQDHGVTCKCCTKITKPSTTCPTKEERNRPKLRGRPKLGGGSEI